MVNTMSSDLAVKPISIVQPTTQDAIGKNANGEVNAPTVLTLPDKAALDSTKGKSLPNAGSDVPPFGLKDNTNQSALENSLRHEDVLDAVKNLNDFVQNTQRELNFSIDEQTGRTVVKVIDPATQEVIRQIPAEEVLAVARRVAEEMDGKGNLFKVEV
jgi:flagellar protein FlaG